MAKMGRPPFDQSIRDDICAEIAKGKSLVTVCKMKGMPSPSTVYEWLRTETDFSDNYARAKTERAERHFEECLEIADAATAETIQVDRLRVDTRKWFVSKMAPKTYGEKSQMELTGADGGPVAITAIERTFVDPKAPDS